MENVETLAHWGIIDYADVTQIGKVGIELHLHPIGQSVRRIEDMDNLAHSDAWREDRGIA